LNVNGESTNDCSKIATEFKNVFVEKIEKLSANVSTDPDTLAEVVPSVDVNWEFERCEQVDIKRIIDHLKLSHSSGPDKISSQLIKEFKHALLHPLTILNNRCLQAGYFPTCFKTGKVVPVLKKASRKNPLNYRPITITSVVGKVVECAANEQLSRATDCHLPPTVFGFRKNMGTVDALVSLMDDIKVRRANGEFVAILICNASAAFDLLDKNLVISMLKRLGAGTNVLNFMSSFLQGSKQYVTVDKCVSEEWSSDVGSGQGHVLSPPLYNIGTISQYYWSKISTLYGYADDGSDVISARTAAECNEKIRAVMELRQRWYSLAGLSLNIQKTSLMGFGFSPEPLVVGDVKIEAVHELKFLGMIIQDNLQVDKQVQSVSSKIRSAAAKIRCEGRNFGTSDRRRLYMGWVQGVLCSNAPAFLPLVSKTQANELQTSCNAAIRSVANIPRHSQDSFSISTVRTQLNIMSVAAITEKINLTQAWKSRGTLRALNLDSKGPTTRAKSNGNVPQPIQKGMRGKLVSTQAHCAFNRLPKAIKEEDNETNAKLQIYALVNVL